MNCNMLNVIMNFFFRTNSFSLMRNKKKMRGVFLIFQQSVNKYMRICKCNNIYYIEMQKNKKHQLKIFYFAIIKALISNNIDK